MMLVLALLALFFQPPSNSASLIIRNGMIVDGSGNPWYYGDVAINGDTIIAVGDLKGLTASVIIDAHRKVIAPGFIDIHSHARAGIFQNPLAENELHEGVTTVVEGNDGSSPLPLEPFLQKVAATPTGINFASFVGQGSIREKVIGLANRKATPEEIEQMKRLTAQAMHDGAFGLSTGLFYVPGNFTPTEEVIELAKVAGQFGGMHISHMRDENKDIEDSVRETIRIGEEGGLPTQVTHHKVIGKANWGKSAQTLALVAAARERGVDVTIDEYPYTASSTGTAAMFPQWSLEGGRTSLLERLAAPDARKRIKTVIMDRILNDRGGGDPKNVVMASCSFDHSLDGQSLAQVTVKQGRALTLDNAAETAMDIQQKGGCSAVYHAIGEDDLEAILRSPYTMVASDGGIPDFGKESPHPRNYGTFARILGRYVRERKTISLETAVRKMSGFPAERLKLLDRGLLRPGMKADIVVFDPATVNDKATFEKPHQYAVGFSNVVVNGKLVMKDGQMTAERPGRVLYGPAYGSAKDADARRESAK